MRSNKWQFDEEFLIKTVRDAKKLLKTNLNETDRIAVEDLIETFSKYLNVKVEPEIKVSKNTDNLTIVKNKFMQKAINSYNDLGQDMIDFIIYLATNISYFNPNHHHKYQKYNANVSPDEIVDKTLELYSIYFEKFYDTAKKIINYPLNLINFTTNSPLGSHCHLTGMFELPFIHIENYKKTPYVFAHELQHGIQFIENYKPDLYSVELGPILLETLYIDRLVKSKEKNAATLYFHRIYEVEDILKDLLSYYSCIKEFRKYNFELSNSKFMNVLYYNNLIYSKENIMFEAIDIDTDNYLEYLLSFFKALEVRGKVYENKSYAFTLLKNYLNYKNVVRYDEEEILNDYDDYCKEVVLKVKKYPHTKRYFKNNE